MSGQRMSGAIANARKIYDQYTTEEDQVGMIAFNHTVEPVFEPREQRAGAHCLQQDGEDDDAHAIVEQALARDRALERGGDILFAQHAEDHRHRDDVLVIP